MRAALLLCLALVSLGLGGCASLGGEGCPQGLKPATTAELYFGRNIGAKEGVSDADWQGFVDTEIAPRFPNGFTIIDANGAWRGTNGEIAHERTKLVRIVVMGGDRSKLAAIRAAYGRRFRQESVLLVEAEGCAGF